MTPAETAQVKVTDWNSPPRIGPASASRSLCTVLYRCAASSATSWLYLVPAIGNSCDSLHIRGAASYSAHTLVAPGGCSLPPSSVRPPQLVSSTPLYSSSPRGFLNPFLFFLFFYFYFPLLFIIFYFILFIFPLSPHFPTYLPIYLPYLHQRRSPIPSLI